jgi:hypothetical protein
MEGEFLMDVLHKNAGYDHPYILFAYGITGVVL